MEKLVISAVLQLAANNNSSITMKEIVGDSLGCCQKAYMRKKHPQLTNNYIALMNPLQYPLKEFGGKLCWKPAHPEKRNSMSANRSRDDCFNHVADRVAVGLVDFDIHCKYELVQVQAEDVMNSLVLPHNWRLGMKDGTTPLQAGQAFSSKSVSGDWSHICRRETV